MGLDQLPGPTPKEDPRSQQDHPVGLLYPEVSSRSQACSQHLSSSTFHHKEWQDRLGLQPSTSVPQPLMLDLGQSSAQAAHG